MPIDNTTTNFSWQLPDASNQLSYDVLRIISALNAIDTAVAARPTTTAMNSAIATAVANLVNSSPTTLDTLKELADALGDDPNFAATMTTALGGKLAKAGDSMSGLLTLAAAGLALVSGSDPDADGKLTFTSSVLRFMAGGVVHEILDSSSAQTATNKTLTSPTLNTPTISGAAAASTIKDGAGNNQSIGYLGIPAKTPWTGPGAYTLVLADAFLEVPTNQAIIIPANAAVALPVGTIIAPRNTGSTPIGISITSDTLTQEGTTNTGARTLAGNGVCMLKKTGATSWLIIGGSVT